MEKVLFNQDLLLYLIEFLPKYYYINLHKICSDIRNIVGNVQCAECKTVDIFLPIYYNNELKCFDCVDKFINDYKFPVHWITREDYKIWEFLESIKKSPYIKCKYCGIKCSNSDFAHYHLIYRCPNYILRIE